MTGGFPSQSDSNVKMFPFDDVIIHLGLGLWATWLLRFINTMNSILTCIINHSKMPPLPPSVDYKTDMFLSKLIGVPSFVNFLDPMKY